MKSYLIFNFLIFEVLILQNESISILHYWSRTIVRHKHTTMPFIAIVVVAFIMQTKSIILQNKKGISLWCIYLVLHGFLKFVHLMRIFLLKEQYLKIIKSLKSERVYRIVNTYNFWKDSNSYINFHKKMSECKLVLFEKFLLQNISIYLFDSKINYFCLSPGWMDIYMRIHLSKHMQIKSFDVQSNNTDQYNTSIL